MKGGRLRDEVTDWEAYQIVNFDSSGALPRSARRDSGRGALPGVLRRIHSSLGASSTVSRVSLYLPWRTTKGSPRPWRPSTTSTSPAGCGRFWGQPAAVPGPGRRARSQGHRHLLRRVSLRRESAGSVRSVHRCLATGEYAILLRGSGRARARAWRRRHRQRGAGRGNAGCGELPGCGRTR